MCSVFKDEVGIRGLSLKELRENFCNCKNLEYNPVSWDVVVTNPLQTRSSQLLKGFAPWFYWSQMFFYC